MVCGRDGRFINQKRPNGKICRFELRMADLILSRVSSLSAVASRSGKPQWPFYQRWPIYQGEAKGGVIDSGPLFGGGFRVILYKASLTLARHVQWLHARARLTGGSLRVASPANGGSARLPPPAELRVVALGAHSPWFAPRFV